MPRLTLPEEIERMSDRIESESGILVQDRNSFDIAFEDVLDLSDKEFSPKQQAFRDDVFRQFLAQHPDVRPDRLHDKASTRQDKEEGFTLRKDRRTTEPLVKTDKEFIEKGTRKFDFAGFDIKESEITKKKIRSRKEFVVPAFVGQQVVFARKEFIMVRGKEQVKHRDSRGRFARIS